MNRSTPVIVRSDFPLADLRPVLRSRRRLPIDRAAAALAALLTALLASRLPAQGREHKVGDTLAITKFVLVRPEDPAAPAVMKPVTEHWLVTARQEILNPDRTLQERLTIEFEGQRRVISIVVNPPPPAGQPRARVIGEIVPILPARPFNPQLDAELRPEFWRHWVFRTMNETAGDAMCLAALEARLDAIQQAAQVSPEQWGRLELAGHGDIQRFHEDCTAAVVALIDEPDGPDRRQKLNRLAVDLRNRFHLGLHGRGSLLDKSAASILTPVQLDQYQRFRDDAALDQAMQQGFQKLRLNLGGDAAPRPAPQGAPPNPPPAGGELFKPL